MADEEKDVQKEEMPENSDVAYEAEKAPAELAAHASLHLWDSLQQW